MVMDVTAVCYCAMLTNTGVSYDFQSLPSKVGSSHEAHQLIGQACKLRVEYQEKKADSLRRLQELLNEVKWIDDKILEVDIHIGKIYHVVDSSGFEIPPPVIAHREHAVLVEGGVYRPYVITFFKFNLPIFLKLCTQFSLVLMKEMAI